MATEALHLAGGIVATVDEMEVLEHKSSVHLLQLKTHWDGIDLFLSF